MGFSRYGVKFSGKSEDIFQSAILAFSIFDACKYVTIAAITFFTDSAFR